MGHLGSVGLYWANGGTPTGGELWHGSRKRSRDSQRHEELFVNQNGLKEKLTGVNPALVVHEVLI